MDKFNITVSIQRTAKFTIRADSVRNALRKAYKVAERVAPSLNGVNTLVKLTRVVE